MPTKTETGFVGWIRLGSSPWRRIVEDGSRDETVAKLLAQADRVKGSTKDLIVLPSGQHPRDRAPCRRGDERRPAIAARSARSRTRSRSMAAGSRPFGSAVPSRFC